MTYKEKLQELYDEMCDVYHDLETLRDQTESYRETYHLNALIDSMRFNAKRMETMMPQVPESLASTTIIE
jgi:hypothetical protein